METEPFLPTREDRFSIRRLKSFGREFLSLWAPTPCDLCGHDLGLDGRNRICTRCFRSLAEPDSSPRCAVCDHPLSGHGCPQCLEQPFPISRLRTLCLHEGVGRSLLHFYKFKYRKPLGRVLAEWTFRVLADEIIWADLLVPIPISQRSMWERNFCPVTLPVRLLSKRTGIPWRPLLEKIPGGSVQHRQSRLARKKSPLRFREASRKVWKSLGEPPRRILVLDDVVTTGSTLAQAKAVLLRRVPDAEIRAIAFARTPMRSKPGHHPQEDGEEDEQHGGEK